MFCVFSRLRLLAPDRQGLSVWGLHPFDIKHLLSRELVYVRPNRRLHQVYVGWNSGVWPLCSHARLTKLPTTPRATLDRLPRHEGHMTCPAFKRSLKQRFIHVRPSVGDTSRVLCENPSAKMVTSNSKQGTERCYLHFSGNKVATLLLRDH